MKIAIKFDTSGNYVSHCADLTITDLNQIVPSNDGFAFYETALDIADIRYFNLKNGIITINTVQKQNEQQQQIRQSKIGILKSQLQSTDYKAIKFAEGEMTEADFAPIRTQRTAWRAEINSLEAQNGTF